MKNAGFSGIEDEKTVFVSGKFNIIHPGHLRLLNFAKTCGKKLIVGLLDDESDGVVLGIEDRLAAVKALEAVDEVVVIEKDGLTNILMDLKPAVVVKGQEYAGANNLEKELVSSYGGRLLFSSGEVRFSSRDLIKKEIVRLESINLGINKDFASNFRIQSSSLSSKVKRFAEKNVLVVGDVILDEYIYCDPLGMSQEDPTIVVAPYDKKYFLGGAGIVAAHLRSLGAKANLITVVGSDLSADIVAKSAETYDLKGHFIVDESRPTILKQRFKSGGTTLLRVSHLSSHEISEDLISEILHLFVRLIDEADCVVFSDFNYGVLPQILVDKLIDLCQRRSTPFFADSQSSSQIGDISRYTGAEIIFATEREARLALNDQKSGLQSIANDLMKKANAGNLFLKLGPEGVILVSDKRKFETELLHSFNSNPKDVAGAGDAMLACSVLMNIAGASIWETGYLGSIAAGIQVSRNGNVPITIDELTKVLFP